MLVWSSISSVIIMICINRIIVVIILISTL